MTDNQLKPVVDYPDIEESARVAARLSKCLLYAIEGLQHSPHETKESDWEAIWVLADMVADNAEETLSTFDAWAAS